MLGVQGGSCSSTNTPFPVGRGDLEKRGWRLPDRPVGGCPDGAVQMRVGGCLLQDGGFPVRPRGPFFHLSCPQDSQGVNNPPGLRDTAQSAVQPELTSSDFDLTGGG